MGLNIGIILFLILMWIYLIAERSKFFLQKMQLEAYEEEQYIKWIQRSNKAYPKKLNKISIYIFATTILYMVLAIVFSKYEMARLFIWVLYNILWISYMILTLERKERKFEKPLIFTNKVKVLFIVNLIFNLLIALIVYLIYIELIGDEPFYFPIALLIGTYLYYFQSYTVYVSNIILKPIENNINNYYFEQAKEKINSMEELDVVGITGSFGKTSTKFITGAILKQKYRVVNTPEKYNTNTGLSKVINEELNEKHQVFIAEMGAKNMGDIKELTKLTKPTIGVITSIGPAHLETFKSLENIMKTKHELIEGLSADGVAIFNYDNQCVKKLADKTFKEKILYGMRDTDELDIYAEDIEISTEGSTFTVKDKKGNSMRCITKLLGEHNIYNILAAIGVATALGLNFKEIEKSISKLEPIHHRLNVINSDEGIIIIDDAFNSNPIGAKAALDVLNQFKEGKKIIVTPGLIDLGEKEEEANKEFGIDIAKVCDYAILIGKDRTIPVYKGLLEEGYNKANILVVDDWEEVTEQIKRIAKPKDIVLFENELPSTYYQ